MSRGEVWTVAGGGDYAGKPRPAVIVQDDRFDATASVTVCVFTTNPADVPLVRPLIEPNERNGLREPSRIMIDKITGKVAYAVLKYGSVLGLGGKLFALPWEVLKYDTAHDAYAVDIPEDRLKAAPSFDANNPPDMADPQWSKQIRDYYGVSAV